MCIFREKCKINLIQLCMHICLTPQSDIHCNRSATSPRPKFKTIAEVAEESQLGFAVGRRLVNAVEIKAVKPQNGKTNGLPWTLWVITVYNRAFLDKTQFQIIFGRAISQRLMPGLCSRTVLNRKQSGNGNAAELQRMASKI